MIDVVSSKSNKLNCRFCGELLSRTFVDLGATPLCQTHISAENLNEAESYYPLRALVCDNCFLVQLDEYVAPADIFEEYAYFSSYSESWLEHAARYCDMAEGRFGLNEESFVVELASNDGYLLRNFVRKGIPCLGIEPAANVAEVARKQGINTVSRFFGKNTAESVRSEFQPADLIIGNNVLAHVPDLRDFVCGISILLGDNGVFTLEFPHLMKLIDEAQFDTIYHEHFSYFSFLTASRVFQEFGLEVFDVEELSTHGGSLRVFGQRLGGRQPVCPAVSELLERELARGFGRASFYDDFQPKVNQIKRDILAFLIQAKNEGKRVAGYGAPGKGNTLLNFCGIGTDFLDYTVDRNPYKQGKYTPGSRIPILSPDMIVETKPDLIFILPWNLRAEISANLEYVSEWGAKFVVPIPRLEVFSV